MELCWPVRPLLSSEVQEKKHEESRKRLQKERKSKTYDDYNWTLKYRVEQLKVKSLLT